MMIDEKGCLLVLALATVAGIVIYAVITLIAGWL